VHFVSVLNLHLHVVALQSASYTLPSASQNALEHVPSEAELPQKKTSPTGSGQPQVWGPPPLAPSPSSSSLIVTFPPHAAAATTAIAEITAQDLIALLLRGGSRRAYR
jgi:hypothetical protein